MKWILLAFIGYFLFSQILTPTVHEIPTANEMALAYQHSPIEMYTTSWCSYCRQARTYMKTHNIPFVEYDIEKDNSAKQRMRQLNGGKPSGVPFFAINGHTESGFGEAHFLTFLARAQR